MTKQGRARDDAGAEAPVAPGAQPFDAQQAGRIPGFDGREIGRHDQARQDPARHRSGDQNADDGKAAKLRKSRKPGEQHASQSQRGGDHRQREGLTDASQGRGCRLALLAVADQQHRVVHGHPQHRHAEADRDTMHEAKRDLHHQGGSGDAKHHRHRDDADTHGERKRHSSKAATRIVEAIDSVSTSPRMS